MWCLAVPYAHGRLPVHFSWADEQTEDNSTALLTDSELVLLTLTLSDWKIWGHFFPSLLSSSPDVSCLCSPSYFQNYFLQLLYSCFSHRQLLSQVTHIDLEVLILVAKFLATNMCHLQAPQCLNDTTEYNLTHNLEIKKKLIANISPHCIILLLQ